MAAWYFPLALAQSSEPSRNEVSRWDVARVFKLDNPGRGWWAGICDPYYVGEY